MIMEIQSKAGLALLALALSCTPMMAQGDLQDPPPEQQGGPDSMGPGGPMEPGGGMRHGGPGEGRGGWGEQREGFGRGERMGQRGFGRGRGEFGLTRLLNNPEIREKVGITAEQAAKIRQDVTEFRKAEIRDRADLEVKRIDLENLLSAEKPDRAAIDAKLQEISAARLILEKSTVHFRLTMREAITPAQREKIRQLMSERWRHEGGPGRAGGPRGQGHMRQHGTAPAPGTQGQTQPKN
jgi:Spy/CpxP family protein refolding chaperone